jgi:hypothetical protein
MDDNTIAAVVHQALREAKLAAEKAVNDNPETWYPCGFAWVKIRPARGKLVNFLKKSGIGSTDTYLGGFTVWNPSGHITQWMDAKYEGALAFARVLNEHGVSCTVHRRMD